MRYCPICCDALRLHTRVGKVVECSKASNPQAWFVVTDQHGDTVAVVVHADMLASAARLFEPLLAQELGFVAPGQPS